MKLREKEAAGFFQAKTNILDFKDQQRKNREAEHEEKLVAQLKITSDLQIG